MDAMGVDAAVIVGHSLGSLNAQRFAVDHPERVLKLVLLGGVRELHEVRGIDEMHAVTMTLRDPVDPTFVRAFQLGSLVHPVPPPVSTPSSRAA